MKRWLILCFLLAPVYPLPFSADAGEVAWPQFRGPTGQGHAPDGHLPLRWSESQGIKWKTPLPGRGWSSPVIADGRIWVTTAEEHSGDALKQQALLKTVEKLPVAKDMIAFSSVTLSALEIDLVSGKLLRRIPLFEPESPPPIHEVNSYASPTPVIADGRVFCHFGTFGTACVEVVSGEVKWRRTLPLQHIVGPGSSPVAYNDLLIVPSDGGDRQYITALNVETGDTVWEKDRPPIRESNPDQKKAFTTPLVINVNGRDQAVIPGAQWFVAYDPTSGDEIWRIDHGRGFSNVARPVFDGQFLYLNTGFGKPQLWAVRADGVGDVSETHVAWRQSQQIPAMSSPVVSQGRVYVISDAGVASCLDAETGKEIWRERVPGKYSASPLAGTGRIYFLSQEGRTTVVADAPKFEVLAESDLDGMLMASPAVANGDLVLRTDTHLYLIGGDR
jgi:outer membrane protein assembly factor BamB